MRGVATEDAHHRVRGVVLHAPDLEGEHLELAVEVHHLVHDVRHHERVDEVALDLDVFVRRVGHVASRGPATLMRRSGPPGPAARTVYLAEWRGRQPRRPLTPPRPVHIVGPQGSGAWRRRSIRTRGEQHDSTHPAGRSAHQGVDGPDPAAGARGGGRRRPRRRLLQPLPRREAHAAHRHGAGAGQPEPVHRHPGHRLHVLAHELRLPRRLRLQDARAAARARDRVGGLRGRQGVDLHHPRGVHVAGRRAGHGARRRVHLQLHRRQRAPQPLHLHQRHHRGGGDRRHARQGHDRRTQGEHAADGRPDPAGAHLEQGQRQGGDHQLPEQAAHHRQRALPAGGVAEGQVRALRGQPGLLGRQAQGGRGRVRALHQPRHDGPGPQARHHRRRRRHPAGAVQAAGQRGGHHHQPVHVLELHRAGDELLRQPGLQGQPRAQGPAVPHGRQLGGRPAEGRRRRLPAVRHARLHAHRPVLQVPLGAAGRSGLHV